MKKLWVILILCVIAFANAFYLTRQAYILKDMRAEQAGKISSFCDIGEGFACSPVLLSPYAQFFGFPFPAVAFVVYPVLALITILALAKKCKKAYPTLAILAAMGTCMNGYYIYQEAVNIKSFCPLCLLCTGIIITICILSIIGWRETRKIA